MQITKTVTSIGVFLLSQISMWIKQRHSSEVFVSNPRKLVLFTLLKLHRKLKFMKINTNLPCTSAQPPAHTSWYDFCAPGKHHTPDTPAPGPPHSKVSAPPCVCCTGAPEQELSLPPRHLPDGLRGQSPPDPDSSSPLCWQQCGWVCSFFRGTLSCTEGTSQCLLGQGPGVQSSSPQCTPGRKCDHRARILAAWKDPSIWSRSGLCWFYELSFWLLVQRWGAAAAFPLLFAQETLLPLVSNFSCLALSPGLAVPRSADKLTGFSSLRSDSCSFLCLDCFPWFWLCSWTSVSFLSCRVCPFSLASSLPVDCGETKEVVPKQPQPLTSSAR